MQVSSIILPAIEERPWIGELTVDSRWEMFLYTPCLLFRSRANDADKRLIKCKGYCDRTLKCSRLYVTCEIIAQFNPLKRLEGQNIYPEKNCISFALS